MFIKSVVRSTTNRSSPDLSSASHRISSDPACSQKRPRKNEESRAQNNQQLCSTSLRAPSSGELVRLYDKHANVPTTTPHTGGFAKSGPRSPASSPNTTRRPSRSQAGRLSSRREVPNAHDDRAAPDNRDGREGPTARLLQFGLSARSPHDALRDSIIRCRRPYALLLDDSLLVELLPPTTATTSSSFI